MNRFLKHWRLNERDTAFQARIVNYADDFVILSRGHAEQARDWTATIMSRIGLTLNEVKTSVKDALKDSFDFLGYTFGRQLYWKTGGYYLAASPSKKIVRRVKEKVYVLLQRNNTSPWAEVRDRLNAMLRGWQVYFS